MTRSQVLMALLVPIVWGLGFTLAKAGMVHFPPFLLVAMRFAITGLVLVWFTRPPVGFLWRICLISLISATIQYGFTFYGLRGLDASTAVLVVQLEAPLLALLATVILKEKFGLVRAMGMALALGGVAVIAGEPRLEGNLIYVGMVIVGVTFWAVGQILVSRLYQVNGMTMIAWVSVMATPQLLVASFVFETGQWEAITSASLIDWGIVLYLAIIMTGVGYSVWYHLLKTCQVSHLSPFLFLTPITSIAAGVLLLDEKITVTMMIGAVMILSGVAATTLKLSRQNVDKVS